MLKIQIWNYQRQIECESMESRIGKIKNSISKIKLAWNNNKL